MSSKKTKKREDASRYFDIASKLFNLSGAINPDKPEQRLRCPICGERHCFDYFRDDAKFYCERCKFFDDIIGLVQKARKVSRNEACSIIKEVDAGLCVDEKLNDSIPTTAETIVPIDTVQELPTPENDIDDTVSEQNDENAAVGYSSHLDIETQMLLLDHIELSDDYKFRAQDDDATIESYADVLQQYCDDLEDGQSVKYPFPPIVVFRENDVHYVISGRHRFQAAKRTGITEMACTILTDRVEAIQEGLKSNRQHGLRLNNADKAHCIKLALNETDWSNRQVADLVGCSRQYVDKIAKKERPSSQDTVTGRDGKKYPSSVKRNEPVEDVEPVEDMPETAPPKTPSNQNEPIIDTLKAALNLPVDTQTRSDALLDVFVTIVADCFKNNQVRRAFLKTFQLESSEYGVRSLDAA
jgi:hypothetical protein